MTARMLAGSSERMRGAVALTLAIALLALLGIAGLALDLGQLFVAKTEQQNAMDACALAASRELRIPPMSGTQIARAEAAGKGVGARNRRLFQAETIPADDIQVTFSDALGGTYVAAASATPNTKFVRCTTQRAGIVTWLMHIFGHDTADVGATAVGSLQGSAFSCGIPLGMCTHSPPDNCGINPVTGLANPGPDANGLCPGKWYSGRFSTGGSVTGNFNWLDFDAAGGGAGAIAAQLQGPGRCNIVAGMTQVAAETGTMGEGVGVAWNSRFGLYKNGAGNPNATNAPPDTTGYAYTVLNHPTGRDAYDDYVQKQAVYESYGLTRNGNPNGIVVGSQYSSTPSGTGSGAHGSVGVTGRRIVVMPAVDCSTWGPGHVATVQGMVCALMTTPYLGPTEVVTLEYLGTVDAAGTKCPTYGGPAGTGPKVPTLVQ